MNRKRLFAAVLVAVILLMSSFAFAENIPGAADEKLISGTYMGFTYYFNAKTGKLVIRGTGKMPTFAPGQAPWAAYAKEAKTVVLSKGITSISENAFGGFTELKTISIPETVTEIAATSFTECKAIEAVEFTGNVEVLQAIVEKIEALQSVEVTSIDEAELEMEVLAAETEYAVQEETAEALETSTTAAVTTTVAVPTYNKGSDDEGGSSEPAPAAEEEEVKNGDYPFDRTRNGTRRVGFVHWENGKMIYQSQDVYENGSENPTFHEVYEFDDNEEMKKNTKTKTEGGHTYVTVHSEYVRIDENRSANTLSVEYVDNVLTKVTRFTYDSNGKSTGSTNIPISQYVESGSGTVTVLE
jgi:hypothetical protein